MKTINPSTPVLAITGCGKCWPLFYLWCHPKSGIVCTQVRTAGGKDLSSDTQIRVIGSVEPEICTKMLRNLIEKLRAKLPVTTHGYSMVKFAVSMMLFQIFLKLEASPVDGQSLQRNDEKRRKSTFLSKFWWSFSFWWLFCILTITYTCTSDGFTLFC